MLRRKINTECFFTLLLQPEREQENSWASVWGMYIENKIVLYPQIYMAGPGINNPKTRAGLREIDVDQVTIEMLKVHIGDRKDGRIFRTRNGTALQNGNIVKQVLKPICKRIGIEPGGMHAFRHARVQFCSRMECLGILLSAGSAIRHSIQPVAIAIFRLNSGRRLWGNWRISSQSSQRLLAHLDVRYSGYRMETRGD